MFTLLTLLSVIVIILS